MCVKINVGKIRIFPLFGPRLAYLLHFELKFRRKEAKNRSRSFGTGKHCLNLDSRDLLNNGYEGDGNDVAL